MDTHCHKALIMKCGEDVLKHVDKFLCLENTVTSKCDVDAVLISRIGAASVAFGKLNFKVYSSLLTVYLR